MSLLNPSPGEIIDRLTILELKIAAAGKKGISTVHFEAEKCSLEERMAQFSSCLVEDHYGMPELLDKVQQNIALKKNSLAALNALLWRAEDDVRATSDSEAFKLARLAKQIAAWNDGRAREVAALNKLYGWGAEEPEKLHASVLEAGK